MHAGLRACEYVCVSACVSMCVSACVRMCACVWVCEWVCEWVWVCAYVWVCGCVGVWASACMCCGWVSERVRLCAYLWVSGCGNGFVHIYVYGVGWVGWYALRPRYRLCVYTLLFSVHGSAIECPNAITMQHTSALCDRLLWKQLTWAPHIHFACSQALCDAIKTTLLCAQRRVAAEGVIETGGCGQSTQHMGESSNAHRNNGQEISLADVNVADLDARPCLPYLPPEIWEQIFRHLGRDLDRW